MIGQEQDAAVSALPVGDQRTIYLRCRLFLSDMPSNYAWVSVIHIGSSTGGQEGPGRKTKLTLLVPSARLANRLPWPRYCRGLHTVR